VQNRILHCRVESYFSGINSIQFAKFSHVAYNLQYSRVLYLLLIL
jgi:hypothetical protein